MKIIVLVENTTQNADLGCEHGLSLYIEACGHTILFDMGQTSLFADNAQQMGVDLSTVDLAVLSHGHYDHGGGLATFFKCNQKASVYLSTHAFEPHYNGTEKYIGLDPALAQHPRLVFTNQITQIDDRITLYPPKSEHNPFSSSNGLLTVQNGMFLPDDFRHEQYLLLEEDGKRVLISGCSHQGILNILDWFQPDVLIGGFHFSHLPIDATLQKLAQKLAQSETAFYTCHCTGTSQFAAMQPLVPNLHYLSTGQTLTLN